MIVAAVVLLLVAAVMVVVAATVASLAVVLSWGAVAIVPVALIFLAVGVRRLRPPPARRPASAPPVDESVARHDR